MNFRKIEEKDYETADRLFQECLADLLKREGFDNPKLWADEVGRLNKAVQKSFLDPVNRFYIAETDKGLLGTIALQSPGPMLHSMVEVEIGELEIACVYVHHAHQRQGVGDFLFQQACKELKTIGKQKFYLDAGFPSSQQYWLAKLGAPIRLIENYWGPEKPHMVWVKNIE